MSDHDLAHDLDELVRLAVVNASIPFFVADEAGRIVMANRSAEELLGYDVGELNGKSVSTLIPERLRERHDGHVRQFTANPQNRRMGVGLDLVALAKDGSQVAVEVALGSFKSPEGLSIVGSIADIRERKRRENELLKELEKNLILLRNGGDGIHILDLNGDVREANTAFCRMLGCERDEVVGMNVARWDAMFEKEKLVPLIRQQYEGGARVEFETVHRRKDGTTFQVEVSGAPVEMMGEPLMVYSSRDITRRKKDAELLRRTADTERALSQILNGLNRPYASLEEMLDEFLENLLSVEWLKIGKKGAVFLVESPETLHLVAQKNLNVPLLSICAKVPFGRCLCGRAAQEQKLLHFPCVDERHENRFEGMQPHGHYNAPLVYEGETLGVFVVYVPEHFKLDDIDLRFLENASSALTGALVRKRAEQSLSHKNRELEKFNAFKSAMVANVSHEYKSPLNIIVGYTEMMLEGTMGDLNEEQQEALSLILNTAHRVNRMVEQMLDLSQVEAGRMKIDPQAIDPRALIEESLATHSISARKQGIHITLDLDDGPPSVWADSDKLVQVLGNLLSNAVKYTPFGGSVIVRLVRDGAFARCSVEDSGPGLPDGYDEKIFEKYERFVDKSGPRGTGLGLVIAKEIVELHGGRIWVESEPQRGAKFFFTVPVDAPAKS